MNQEGFGMYVVTAYRYGFRDAHSYVVGCELTYDLAVRLAHGHFGWRNGRYAIEVVECEAAPFGCGEELDWAPEGRVKVRLVLQSPYESVLRPGGGRMLLSEGVLPLT